MGRKITSRKVPCKRGGLPPVSRWQSLFPSMAVFPDHLGQDAHTPAKGPGRFMEDVVAGADRTVTRRQQGESAPLVGFSSGQSGVFLGFFACDKGFALAATRRESLSIWV